MRRFALALALIVPSTAQALPLVNSGGVIQSRVGDQLDVRPGATTTGATTFSVVPPLPTGLTMDPTSGRITGSASTSAAVAEYVVTVGDTSGTATASLRLGVSPATSAIEYSSPVVASVGSRLTVTPGVIATGPATFTVAPALPAGLTLDRATGTISGQPLAAHVVADYVVSLTDANGTVSSTIRLVVDPTSVTVTSDGVPARSPEPGPTISAAGEPALPVFPSKTSGQVLTARVVRRAVVHAAFSPRSHVVARLTPGGKPSRYQVLAATRLGSTLRYKIVLPGKKTGWVDARFVKLVTVPNR